MRLSSSVGTNNATLTSILNAIYGSEDGAGKLIIGLSGRVQATPHAKTSRDTYTVPANKVAIVSGIGLLLENWLVSTTTGTAITNVEITPNGGALVSVYECSVRTPSVPLISSLQVPCRYVLGAGDNIDVQTQNTAIGGSVNHVWNVMIVEYDAP